MTIEAPATTQLTEAQRRIVDWDDGPLAAFAELDRRFSGPPAHDPDAAPAGPPARLRLEENFRSVEPVLMVADRLVLRNEHRYAPDKVLRPMRGAGAPVELVIATGAEDEAREIADRIMAWSAWDPADVTAPRPDWSRYAVLYHKHRHRGAIVDRLRDAGIPYTVVGGLSLFDTPAIRDLEQSLRAITDPHDASLKTGRPESQKGVQESLQSSSRSTRSPAGTRSATATPEKVTLYFTEHASRMSATRSDEELAAARDELAAWVTRVRSGDFAATPSANTCWTCDHQAICPERVRWATRDPDLPMTVNDSASSTGSARVLKRARVWSPDRVSRRSADHAPESAADMGRQDGCRRGPAAHGWRAGRAAGARSRGDGPHARSLPRLARPPQRLGG